MPGPRGPRGPKPQIKNPGKLLARLLKTVISRYAVLWVIVLICLLLSVFANTQGTMFIQSLIDDYITPLLANGGSDYGPLLGAMGRVAGF